MKEDAYSYMKKRFNSRCSQRKARADRRDLWTRCDGSQISRRQMSAMKQMQPHDSKSLDVQ
jgi:hypothetical protein